MQYLEDHKISISQFERDSKISNGYLTNTNDRKAEITQKILDRIRQNNSEVYFKIFPEEKPKDQTSSIISSDEDKPTMKDMRELLASNRELAIANRRLSDAHYMIAETFRDYAKSSQPLPVSSPEEIPAAIAEKFANILEIIANVGTGETKWKDLKTAHEELNKFWLSSEQGKKAVHIGNDQGK